MEKRWKTGSFHTEEIKQILQALKILKTSTVCERDNSTKTEKVRAKGNRFVYWISANKIKRYTLLVGNREIAKKTLKEMGKKTVAIINIPHLPGYLTKFLKGKKKDWVAAKKRLLYSFILKKKRSAVLGHNGFLVFRGK